MAKSELENENLQPLVDIDRVIHEPARLMIMAYLYVIESADFFSRIVFKVLHGERPTAAIERSLNEGFDREPYSKWIEEGFNTVEKDTRQTMLNFGQMCEIEAAFPCVIHLIAKYEDDLKEGLIENAMAGGDSAGRGLTVGMVLGAYLGGDVIPPKWLSELKSRREIVDLLNRIG